MTPEFLTAKEVQARLRIGRNAIYDLARRRQIEYVRIGQKILFPVTAVEEFIQRNTVTVRREFFSVGRHPFRNHKPGPRTLAEKADPLSKDVDGHDAHSSIPAPSLRRS